MERDSKTVREEASVLTDPSEVVRASALREVTTSVLTEASAAERLVVRSPTATSVLVLESPVTR